jgi:hypothetical protein
MENDMSKKATVRIEHNPEETVLSIDDGELCISIILDLEGISSLIGWLRIAQYKKLQALEESLLAESQKPKKKLRAKPKK